MGDFDFNQSKADRALIEQLATLAFTDAAHNVVLIGSTGTGKSHLATAIAVNGITQHGKHWLIWRVFQTLNDAENLTELIHMERK